LICIDSHNDVTNVLPWINDDIGIYLAGQDARG